MLRVPVPPWTANFRVDINGNRGKTCFNLDSGAAATVCRPGSISCPPQLYIHELRGPGNIPIPCIGKVDATLCYGDKSIRETIYVVQGQSVNLLSKSACQHLNLLTCLLVMSKLILLSINLILLIVANCLRV